MTPQEKATDEAIAEIFSAYDTDKNGTLEYTEARAFFQEVCQDDENEECDE